MMKLKESGLAQFTEWLNSTLEAYKRRGIVDVRSAIALSGVDDTDAYHQGV